MKPLTRADREAQREADLTADYYDDGIEAPKEEVRCKCWLGKEGELISGEGCPVHGVSLAAHKGD